MIQERGKKDAAVPFMTSLKVIHPSSFFCLLEDRLPYAILSPTLLKGEVHLFERNGKDSVDILSAIKYQGFMKLNADNIPEVPSLAPVRSEYQRVRHFHYSWSF